MSVNGSGGTAFYDVLIVGAGPAGASAARALVRNGYRVLMLERNSLPRYKMCSGLINDRAQDLIEESFGTPPEEVFCRPRFIDGVRLCLAGDSFRDLRLDDRKMWNVWRSAFDHWLVQTSGADVLDDHQLVSFEQTPQRIQARVRRSGKEALSIDASYLIGADGGQSLVRRLVEPDLVRTIAWFTATQVYCSGTVDLEPEYFYAFFDPSLRALYAWLNFKDDYVVYGVSAEQRDQLEPSLRNTTEYLTRTFGLAIKEVVRKRGCVITDMGVTRRFLLGRGRVLLAGEAAGFMNVLGEGISSAVATGQVAATAIHQAALSGRAVLPIYTDLAKPEEELTTRSWELADALLGRKFLSTNRQAPPGNSLEVAQDS